READHAWTELVRIPPHDAGAGVGDASDRVTARARADLDLEGRARRVDRRLQERLGAPEVVLSDSDGSPLAILRPPLAAPGGGAARHPFCRRAATWLSGRETNRGAARATTAGWTLRRKRRSARLVLGGHQGATRWR